MVSYAIFLGSVQTWVQLLIESITQIETMQKALRKHSAIDLLVDTAQLGIIAAAEVTGHLIGKGNNRVIETANEKFKERVSTKHEQAVAHSASRE